MSIIEPGMSPPTPAVNARTQCVREGCGTMLLSDGSCPRCNPPTLRSTADKLRLAEEYKDERLQRRAHAEIDAGAATGLGDGPLDPRRQPLGNDDVVEQLHQRVDTLEQRLDTIDARITEGFGDLLGELRSAREKTPTVTETATATAGPTKSHKHKP